MLRSKGRLKEAPIWAQLGHIALNWNGQEIKTLIKEKTVIFQLSFPAFLKTKIWRESLEITNFLVVKR